MQISKSINIARDFSFYPGARFKKQGVFSAEEFRDDLFLPALQIAINNNSKVELILDGLAGYPPSFLEEVFGGAVRVLKNKDILKHIHIIADTEPCLIEEIQNYINYAVQDICLKPTETKEL